MLTSWWVKSGKGNRETRLISGTGDALFMGPPTLLTSFAASEGIRRSLRLLLLAAPSEARAASEGWLPEWDQNTNLSEVKPLTR
jgi:hypothetical protein